MFLFRYVLTGKWIACLVIVWDESLTGYLYFDDDCGFFLHSAAETAYYLLGILIYFVIPSLIMPYLHAHILYVVCGSYRKIRSNLDQQSKSSSFWSQMKLTGMLLLVYLSIGGSGRGGWGGGGRGGVPGARHPLWDPILLFSHTFSPKSARIGGPHPPNGSMPPYGKSWIRHCCRSLWLFSLTLPCL